MPNLNIEDFSDLYLKVKEKNIEETKPDTENESISVEEVEKYYLEKIRLLEEKYQKHIEEERKKAFEEGYKKAKEELEKHFKEKLEATLSNAIKEKEEEINKKLKEKNKEISKILNQLKEKYMQKIDFIEELIISSLEEILNYLYLHPSNREILEKEIRDIIRQIKNSYSIKITISPYLKEYFKDVDKNEIEVDIDENLSQNDFIIEFDHVQIESNFKEKVKILKDEIKREIKKNSQI